MCARNAGPPEAQSWFVEDAENSDLAHRTDFWHRTLVQDGPFPHEPQEAYLRSLCVQKCRPLRFSQKKWAEHFVSLWERKAAIVAEKDSGAEQKQARELATRFGKLLETNEESSDEFPFGERRALLLALKVVSSQSVEIRKEIDSAERAVDDACGVAGIRVNDAGEEVSELDRAAALTANLTTAMRFVDQISDLLSIHLFSEYVANILGIRSMFADNNQCKEESSSSKQNPRSPSGGSTTAGTTTG